MNHDISQSVSQRGNGANDKENRRIHEIADELQRLCRLHEKESRDSKTDGSLFEIEQRVAEPRNVLADDEGDIYVIDAEIKQIG